MNLTFHPARRARRPHATLLTGLMALLATLALLWAAPAQAAEPAARPAAKSAAEAAQPRPAASGRITANGIAYYYEIHGRTGEPLLLLHGGLGSIDMFGPVLPALAKSRRVIAVDLHGHGRTPLGDRPISLPDMGNDLAGVLDQLGFGQVDVLGYSMGAGVAFRLAVQHPQKVRRLVLASGAFAQDGFYPEMLPMQAQVGAAMADAMKGTPMYESYAKVAPRPQDFPKLLDRMGELMRQPYDWAADVKTLKMPVMLVYGDSDMFRPEHVVRFYQLLGGGLRDAGWQREHMSRNRLAILPDLTHYELFVSPRLAATVLPFLDGRSDVRSWASQVKR
ncbi:alpha/beta fold hydrolase [Aquabacterium humicola]|uniref:alpha/beta fold hydrolase n=1 Tax=Aquabacterium humicola TaxID=3237377 RepID=UPI002542E2E9|nr:alpha/beta hydrolase [Rubrivivax pictus]